MMPDQPSFYGIIPANVRYDKNLTPNAKLLFSEITVMTKIEGYCWASNNYFARVFSVTPQAVSKWIKALHHRGYITVEYERRGKEIVNRKISLRGSINIDTLSTKDSEGINKCFKRYQQKIKEINTRDNNTSINTREKPKQERFIPPTVEEVQAYCEERKNGIDPVAFVAYYQATNWMRGKTKLKNWKAAVITWERNRKDNPKERKIQTAKTVICKKCGAEGSTAQSFCDKCGEDF